MKGVIRDTGLDYLIRVLFKRDPPLPTRDSPRMPPFNSETLSHTATEKAPVTPISPQKNGTVAEKKLVPQTPKDTFDGLERGVVAENVVGWYGPDDPEVTFQTRLGIYPSRLKVQNPLNFSPYMKAFICAEIFFLNTFLYLGSSIYAPGIPGLMQDLHTSQIVATLGTSLSIIGFATGPMLWSPVSEVPKIGRNPVYITTLAVFILLQLPIALAPNVETVLIFRFLSSFFGSPAMALGGATVNDMYLPLKRSYGLAVWELSTWVGPALGPLIGGFAVQTGGWRWTIWELVWINVPMLLFTFCFLPETSASNILYRRAKRMRQSAQNPSFRSEAELRPLNVSGGGLLYETIARPWILCFQEPICLLLNAYTALICMLIFAWLEIFPIVFTGLYAFSPGAVGLAYLGLLSGAILALLIFAAWFHWTESKEKNFNDDDDDCRRRRRRGRQPEKRFIPLMAGCWLIPISLFVFGWSARPRIHWIVPILGSGLFSIGGFTVFVSSYIPPKLPPPPLQQHLPLQKTPTNHPSPIDLNPKLPPRRLPQPRRLCPRRQHLPTVCLWLRLRARRGAHVRSARSRVGEYTVGYAGVCVCAGAVSVFLLWGADSGEE